MAMTTTVWRHARGMRAALFAMAMAVAMPVLAVEPDERLADAAQEARARALSSELRCLVCQNQSIDDSSAPLARDLRLLVREQIKAGKSDVDVMAHIVARYGDFVLLRPRLTLQTALLWLTPLLILLAAGYGLARRRSSTGGGGSGAEALTADEQRRLDDILGNKT